MTRPYTEDEKLATRITPVVNPEVALGIAVPADWITAVVHRNWHMSRSGIGHWASGRRPVLSTEATLPPTDVWLIYESDTLDLMPAQTDEAVRAYRAGSALPPRWHLLDQAAAIRAHVEGVKRWGVEWQSSAYASEMGFDIVLQLALLGEVRYWRNIDASGCNCRGCRR